MATSADAAAKEREQFIANILQDEFGREVSLGLLGKNSSGLIF
jgi:hypothetical protein